ncbi:MAG: ATP-binding cassette domain-containing protein [Burkholderiaceae bacterium]|nr:ATP-binding cassette domain-containing protein [Burkholderiaceae bacterium]
MIVSLRDLRAAAAPGATAQVLRGLSLDIRRGEQLALIGSSGAGKTSLLQALACAVPPLSGTLTLCGVDPWTLSTRARQRLRGRLFLAPQVPPLPPRQRVVTAVLAGRLPAQSLWASLRTLWHPREAALAQAALAALDLGDKLWERVDRLSGGERQRVGLARALVADAALWLIDEPLSALDPARAEQVIDSLTAAARSADRTLVCSLHQVEVARRRFPRIVALREGVIVYDGAASAFTDAQVSALYGTQGLADTPPAAVGEPEPKPDAHPHHAPAEMPVAIICR